MNSETESVFIVLNGQDQPSSSTQKLINASATQVNLDNVEDFSNVCRTCATITEFVIPIFSGEGLQNNLADKIHKHLPIQVSAADELPRVLCYQCASTLLAWHELAACCAQADAALRARLQEKPTNIKSSSSIEEEAQSKFTAITEYVVQSLEPPKYREPMSPALGQRHCTYCTTSHDNSSYQEHLITAHADLLFYCEECDNCIDRKDFILHMSLHAAQYSSRQVKKEKRRKVNKKEERSEVDINQNTNETEEDPTTTDQKSMKENQENEFSDHSDMEYGFGPLPESVFEAIEDSQDSQPYEEDTSHSPENEPASEESNKSILPNLEDSLSNSMPPGEASNLSPPLPSVQSANESNAVENNEVSNSGPPDESNKNQSKKDVRKTRTCPICSKTYTASSSYFYHMKYFHQTSKNHRCEICEKKFGTKASLIQHASIHTGERQFECKECKKRFRSKASLYIHEQTHNGIKSWSCTQCHRSFRWRTHLLRHMKRHSAEKGHVCTTCGRGFNIRCDLLRHARTHTAGNFECEKCKLKFAQMRYLKVHMDKKHSTNIVKKSQ